MENIEFWKMNGSGNDFILIDNRDGIITEENMPRLVAGACRRRESVGADGLIFVTNSDSFDFAWRFFNADGGEVEMCGNGSRCVARFAYLKGITGSNMTFETLAGPISAEVTGKMVKVLMPKPTDLRCDIGLALKPGWISVDYMNTGVPHVVVQVEDIRKFPVVQEGKSIRCDGMFAPDGTNANFMSVQSSDSITVRTYERGVEDETLACGTGAIASTLAANIRGMVESPVKVTTTGGEVLTVHFNKQNDSFEKVWLEGGTAIAYKGQLNEEAL